MIRVLPARLSLIGAAVALTLTACQKETHLASTARDSGEPSSNLNLDLTETILSRDTVAAGENVRIQIFTKNASGERTHFKNIRVQLSLRGGSSLGTFSEVIPSNDGSYSTEFTARRAGTPSELEILINGQAPRGRAPKLTVVPGTVSLSQSTVSVTDPQVAAGTSTRVVFKALDALGNQLTTGGLNVTFALNGGTSAGQFGPVVDHQDGTYSAEFTGLTAGGPSPALAKVGGDAVTSPLPALTVVPGRYSPLMTQITTSVDQVVSGQGVEIMISAHDAYGNRLTEGGQAFELALKDGSSTGAFGPVRDLGNGTYTTVLTGHVAGSPVRVTATSAGQTVGTSTLVTVMPGKFDAARSSVTCAASKITLGGSFVCTLTLKDQHGSPTSSGVAADTNPTLALQEGTSLGEFAAPQSTSPGTYTFVFTATKDGTPSRVIASVGNDIASSSTPSIEVLFPSLKKSEIVLETDKIKTGKNTFVRFQARDASGAPITADGLTIAFEPTGTGSSAVEIGAVQDRGGGTYVAAVTGKRAGSPIHITAKINDREFEGQTPALTVAPENLTRLSAKGTTSESKPSVKTE